MNNYKITGGTVLLSEGDVLRTEEKTVYVSDGKITFSPLDETENYEPVDASRKLVMPGLINMHTHAYMTMMRNYADDLPFTEWLFRKVMPVEDSL
ncbi:MAG: amidohydrolase family protein, partial [Eubacterium sp.]|nr:amidohydrolase family protein [Eubacterium sp.]